MMHSIKSIEFVVSRYSLFAFPETVRLFFTVTIMCGFYRLVKSEGFLRVYKLNFIFREILSYFFNLRVKISKFIDVTRSVYSKWRALWRITINLFEKLFKIRSYFRSRSNRLTNQHFYTLKKFVNRQTTFQYRRKNKSLFEISTSDL